MTEFPEGVPAERPLTELELHAASYGTFDEHMKAVYDLSRAELGASSVNHLPVLSLAEQQARASKNHALISSLVHVLPDLRGLPSPRYIPVRDQAEARIALANTVKHESSFNTLSYIVGARLTRSYAELMLCQIENMRNSDSLIWLNGLSIERVGATAYQKAKNKVDSNLKTPLSDTELASVFDPSTRNLRLQFDDWPGMAIVNPPTMREKTDHIMGKVLLIDLIEGKMPDTEYESAELSASVRAAGLRLDRHRKYRHAEQLPNGVDDETMAGFDVYRHLGNLATAFNVSEQYQKLLNRMASGNK